MCGAWSVAVPPASLRWWTEGHVGTQTEGWWMWEGMGGQGVRMGTGRGTRGWGGDTDGIRAWPWGPAVFWEEEGCWRLG